MIRTEHKGFKRSVKYVEYGTGDIWSVGFSNKEHGIYGIGLYNGEPGEIGRTLPESTHEERMDAVNKKSEVVLTFKNIESLDVMIQNLEQLKEHMIK